jgi:hypothetical protein
MGERRSAYWVWRVNLKARAHLKDLGKEGTQYKNVSSRNRTEVEGVDSILLAYDRYKWWALVDTVMNFRVT